MINTRRAYALLFNLKNGRVNNVANSWRNNISSSNIVSVLRRAGEYEKMFAFLFFLYVTNETLLKKEFLICRNHFNDLLAIPLLLSYSGILIKRIAKKRMSISFMVSITIVSSFIWEYLTPIVIKGSTGDWFDVLTYFIGLGIFVIIKRRRAI